MFRLSLLRLFTTYFTQLITISKEDSLKKLKWTPVVMVKKATTTPERFEQLLAETAEILYKRLSQQVQVEFQGQKISTEPALIIKKAASQ